VVREMYRKFWKIECLSVDTQGPHLIFEREEPDVNKFSNV